jgi:hypothetical protein
MNASRSKLEVFNQEIAEKTEVLRRNNECACARTEDVNARLVNAYLILVCSVTNLCSDKTKTCSDKM